MEDWESLIREIRARVETTSQNGVVELHEWACTRYRGYCVLTCENSFSQYLLPPNPLLSPPSSCPLPQTPSLLPHLNTLLAQTTQHLSSPDTPHLLQLGVSAVLSQYTQILSEEVYGAGGPKRLVDCLPCFGRVGKGVWEGIPDYGVEVCLSRVKRWIGADETV